MRARKPRTNMLWYHDHRGCYIMKSDDFGSLFIYGQQIQVVAILMKMHCFFTFRPTPTYGVFTTHFYW